MMVAYYLDCIASLDKGTHGFPGPERRLISLFSLMGVSPSASSALSAAVHAPGKLADPPFWRVFRKTEDAGIPAYVKDDNAAKDVSERPAGICALVKRR